MIAISELSPGNKAVVCTAPEYGPLQAMGVRPGKEIRIVSQIMGTSVIATEVADVSLNRKMAQMVFVERGE